MRRAQSNSPRLPSKNQCHEEARLSHLLLLPDSTPRHLPARPPSYPAAAPSHAQRERAEFQLRQLGSGANVPRIRVSCEPDQVLLSQPLLRQGQEERGRSPGRSAAWDSEVVRQILKPRLDLHLYYAGCRESTFSRLLSDLSGKALFPSLVQNSMKVGFGGIWWIWVTAGPLSFLSGFVLYKVSLTASV